ncbi:hypothetical protein V4F39_07445 [Aquincola sp. MAHUQ-54]|uniref:Uncharacterized protein n=1 Tax=Aquincola agrisoli TaxID=3119538 RepID=A0AAW9QEH0_9BURK
MTPDAGGEGGRFTGLREFREVALQVLHDALAAGQPDILLLDADFAAWPLDDAGLLQALTRWARAPQRRLHLLARHYEELPRRHPRFVHWRDLFAHVALCRAAPGVDASEFPVLVLTRSTGLYATAPPSCRGYKLVTEADLRTWREVFDAISQRSEEASPGHSLGL